MSGEPGLVARDPAASADAGGQSASGLLIRVLSAAVLLGVVLGAIALGPPWIYGVLAALILFATYEYYVITRGLGHPAAPLVLFPLVVVLLFRFQLNAVSPGAVPAAVSAAVVLGLAGHLFAPGSRDAFTRWALGVAGALYLGWSLGYYFALYAIHQPDPARVGTAWLVALAGSTVLGDTAALLVGTRWGRHPFFPEVSPKKTVEGAAAAFVIQALGFAGLALLADLPVAHGLLLGCLVAIAAQAGDLVESQLKRSAGLKDAGRLVPGHGGMLDRIDSLILIPAVAYYYLELVLHIKLPQ